MTGRPEELVARPRSLLLLLGVATLVLFGGVGSLLITGVQHRDLPAMLRGPVGWGTQVPLGIGSGLAIGWVAWWLVSLPFMRPVLDRYAERIGPLLGNRSDQMLVSMCAGAGEELFFRGAVQHWLGIPITAVLFVALHGYLDPRKARVSLYGAVLSIAMMLLGWMVGKVGLLAPMIAHAVIDMVLLDRLHARWRTIAGTTKPDG